MTPSALDRLTAGLHLIRTAGWTQYTLRDLNGSVCTLGALTYGVLDLRTLEGDPTALLVAHRNAVYDSAYLAAVEALNAAIAELMPDWAGEPLPYWNDMDERTQLEVEAAFELAIQKLTDAALPTVHDNAPATAVAASGA